MSKRNIAVVSSSRADYSHLYPLMFALKNKKNVNFQLIITGMHLSEKYGNTYKEIVRDGFKINAKIQTKQSISSEKLILHSMSEQLANSHKSLTKLKPDIVIILGDRYDILPIAISCLIMQIPLAHIHGGEVTYGAIDDSIRHTLTKLSHIHFVASEEFKKRVIQLGEMKKNIFNIGSIGVSGLQNIKNKNIKIISKELGFKITKKYFVIAIHPETINGKNNLLIRNLLSILGKLKNFQLIFTYPNSDTNSDIILKEIKKFIIQNQDNCFLIKSTGRQLFINLLRNSSGIIGNSSSGIIEAPSLGIPSLNIGNRQKGRPLSKSVISCSYSEKVIKTSIDKILKFRKSNDDYKYKSTNSIGKIINKLTSINIKNIKNKIFQDI